MDTLRFPGIQTYRACRTIIVVILQWWKCLYWRILFERSEQANDRWKRKNTLEINATFRFVHLIQRCCCWVYHIKLPLRIHIMLAAHYRFRFLVRLGVFSASWLDGFNSMMIGMSFAFGPDSSLLAWFSTGWTIIIPASSETTLVSIGSDTVSLPASLLPTFDKWHQKKNQSSQ